MPEFPLLKSQIGQVEWNGVLHFSGVAVLKDWITLQYWSPGVFLAKTL